MGTTSMNMSRIGFEDDEAQSQKTQQYGLRRPGTNMGVPMNDLRVKEME